MAEYRWGDVLPIEQGGQATTTGWGGTVTPARPQQEAEPPEGRRNLLEQILNPMTLAGLSGFESAWRGGNAFPAMEHGWKIGQAQEDARKKAVQEAALKAMLNNPQTLGGLPPALVAIAKATGDVGPLAQLLIKQNDPTIGRTDDIKEYEYAVQRGFKGSLQDWMVNKKANAGEYNKNPIYGTRTNPDGTVSTVMLQAGSRGDAVETKLPNGVAVNSQKPIEIDAGTHTVLLDPITRQPIAQISKNKAEAARQTEVGQGQGQAQVNLHGVESNADRTIEYIDKVLKDPNLDSVIGPVAGWTPNVSTGARDVQAKVDQLKGRAFLEAFAGLKGAGAITETEGTKATAALTRLAEQRVGTKEYREALQDFKDEVNRLRELARRKAGAGGPSGNAGFSLRRID